MSIEKRISKLENVLRVKDRARDPLLMVFIGDEYDNLALEIKEGYEPPGLEDVAGILYDYNTKPATEYRLNEIELARYKATGELPEIEI